MPTDPVAGRPAGRRGVYRDVYDHYVQLIDIGRLRPGDRVPTSSMIADTWNISHATAAKALQALRDDQYVTSSSKGTYVAYGKLQRLLVRLAGALNDLEDEHQHPRLIRRGHDSYIEVREGGVWWNDLTQRWEPADI